MYQLNKRTRDVVAPVIADLLSHVLAGIRAPSYECMNAKRPREGIDLLKFTRYRGKTMTTVSSADV